MFVSLCLLLSCSHQVAAIKFAADGVTASSDILRVNEDTQLSCKYIMWKQETLASVTWSIQYTGVKTDFFVYRADGRKDVVPGVSLVSVFTDRSNDKSVSLMLTDSREREVSFCCHVMVLRDDGYGSMTTKEKEKCSGRLPVESVRRIQERASVTLECPDSGSIGQTLQLVCQGTGLSEYQSLKLTVNGQEVALPRDRWDRRLEYSLTLHESHFRSRRGNSPQMGTSTVAVECLVMQGRTVAANSTTLVREDVIVTPPPIGVRFGGGGVERNGRAFSTAEEHRTHPSHAPCQSYLLVQEMRNGGTLLLGRLSYAIQEDIPNPYETAQDRYETSMSPVSVLTVLGFHGHRVVGVTTNMDNLMVWTLERKYYEFHQP